MRTSLRRFATIVFILFLLLFMLLLGDCLLGGLGFALDLLGWDCGLLGRGGSCFGRSGSRFGGGLCCRLN